MSKSKKKKSPAASNLIPRTTALELIVEHGIDIVGKRLYLSGEVGDQMYDALNRGLSVLNQAASVQRIEIILNTGGGDLYAAVGMFDAIKANSVPVDVRCQGACMSAGTLILQAAKRRTADPLCQFMVHHGYESFSGEVGTARRYNEHYKDFEKQVCNLYVKRTGMTMAQIKKLFDRDTFMSAEKALQIGLIDSVYQ